MTQSFDVSSVLKNRCYSIAYGSALIQLHIIFKLYKNFPLNSGSRKVCNQTKWKKMLLMLIYSFPSNKFDIYFMRKSFEFNAIFWFIFTFEANERNENIFIVEKANEFRGLWSYKYTVSMDDFIDANANNK